MHLLEDGVLSLRYDRAVQGSANVAQQLLVSLGRAAREQAAAVDRAQCCDALAPWMQLPKACQSSKTSEK